MRILIVGSNKPWAIERYYHHHLTDWGAEVKQYNAPDIVFDNHSKDIFNKLLFKTGIKTGYREVNAELLEQAFQFDPDWILVFKGMEIFPSTLRRLKTKFRLANYNPDHPFIFSGRGSGNSNVTESVGLYNLHFCYNRNLQQTIENEFHLPAVFLPFGFELSQEDYVSVSVKPEIARVCFIGNPDRIRLETIQSVLQHGFPADVYGHGWDRTKLKHVKQVALHDAVYGLEYWEKLRQYRIQLNIFRIHNEASHNMRSFEIPAVGGVQLAPYSEEQALFFEAGKEVFFYRDRQSMVDHIKDLLSYSTTDILTLRNAARRRSLDSGYSYKKRASTVLEAFQTYSSGH